MNSDNRERIYNLRSGSLKSRIQNPERLLVGALIFAYMLGGAPIQAQQPHSIARVGLLFSGSRSSNSVDIDAFRAGLRDLGYAEGKNILLEYRFADGEFARVSGLVAELVQLKVDVIVAGGTRSTTAAKQATSTIPIVVGDAGDLVAAGLVASLARPGGNVTGSTRISKDLSGKRIELLRETIPKVARVAVLMSSATAVLDRVEVKEIETTGQHLGVKLQAVDVKDPKDFQSAYATMVKEHANAVLILQGAFTSFHHKQLVDLALKHRLASMCEGLLFTNAGCLMSYGPDVPHLWRRAAILVDKILKGAKPADLPVEQPTKFEFVINLKTAKALNLTIPQSVLFRADRVIR
jgi:putative tryptophan/tyrosine transport system substrate-binding protein